MSRSAGRPEPGRRITRSTQRRDVEPEPPESSVARNDGARTAVTVMSGSSPDGYFVPAGGPVRRAHDGGEDRLGGRAVPEGIDRVLRTRRGGGVPLPDGVAEEMGAAFGADLSHVRVHVGSEPADVARRLDARAFTYGHDVYFGAGVYRPGTSAGQAMLGHELAHVVQGSAGGSRTVVGRADDPAEFEADRLAHTALGRIRRARTPDPAGDGPNEIRVRPPVALDGPKPAVIQRYADFVHPEHGRMFVSEGWAFLKRANEPRDLWAGPHLIKAAAETMDKNPIGILAVGPGEAMTFLQTQYRRVVVRDRPPRRPGGKEKEQEGRPSTKPAPVDPLQQGARDPFDIVLNWVGEQCRNPHPPPMTNLVQALGAIPNPYGPLSYASGAFTAIRVQVSLLMDQQETTGGHYFEKLGAVTKYLVDWKDRVAKVNSEDAHHFNFLCTECGGFSMYVMAGKESAQPGADVGDRVVVKGLGDLPGPWQNHYAAVLMTDGGDRATLESAAGMDEWWFGIYGDQRAEQTFVAKTLIKKFEIGVSRGEPLSQECLNYTRALLAGDGPEAMLWRAQLGGHAAEIDTVLGGALAAVEQRTERVLAKVARV